MKRGARLSRGVLAVAVAALLLGAGASGAYAEDEAEARAHFNRGESLFKAKKFLDAAREFEAGFVASPRPLFLLNIGHSYRRAHEFRKAKAAYEMLLRVEPQTKHRAEVEGLIKTIDDTLDNDAPVAPAPGPRAGASPPPPAPAPAPDRTPAPPGSATVRPPVPPAAPAAANPPAAVPSPAPARPSPAPPARPLPPVRGPRPAVRPAADLVPLGAEPRSESLVLHRPMPSFDPEPDEPPSYSMWRKPWLWAGIGAAVVAVTVIGVMTFGGASSCAATACVQEPRRP
jgi:hypothetical protein